MTGGLSRSRVACPCAPPAALALRADRTRPGVRHRVRRRERDRIEPRRNREPRDFRRHVDGHGGRIPRRCSSSAVPCARARRAAGVPAVRRDRPVRQRLGQRLGDSGCGARDRRTRARQLDRRQCLLRVDDGRPDHSRDDSADLGIAEELLGWHDAVPVVTEPFTEWVLQGSFPAGRPEWRRPAPSSSTMSSPMSNETVDAQRRPLAHGLPRTRARAADRFRGVGRARARRSSSCGRGARGAAAARGRRRSWAGRSAHPLARTRGSSTGWSRSRRAESRRSRRDPRGIRKRQEAGLPVGRRRDLKPSRRIERSAHRSEARNNDENPSRQR